MKNSRSIPVLRSICLIAVLGTGFCSVANAGWQDTLNNLKNKYEEHKGKKGGKLSEQEIGKGLKEALRVGARKSVDKLGRLNGYYKDGSVRIPMPEKLKKVDKLMRRFGQGKLMDQFTLTMNRAAEQAVKSTFDIFADAIKQITITDAVRILSGRDNEATEYFREKKSVELHNVIFPIVRKATQETGVTSNYKKISNKTKKFSSTLARQLPDIDAYVTEKALHGLFVKIAEKEAEIRKNPRARTTALLKRVFGS